MLRVALANYLTVVLVAGPWLCCCMSARLCALLLRPTGEEHVTEAAPSCCGHRGGGPDQSDAKEEQAPESPPSAPDTPCPCKCGQRAPSIVTASENSSAAEWGRLLTVNPVEDGWLAGATIPQTLHAWGQTPKEPNVCPFHSPRDILRALHVLRC